MTPTPSPIPHRWLAAMIVAMTSAVLDLHAFPVITDVVETGGDNEATDTITAKWTGVTFVNGVANEPVAGKGVNDPYTVGLLDEEAPAYVDRAHQWNGATLDLPLPSYLVGAEYIMIGNDNRDNASLRLDITVSEPAIVYLLIDNRLTDGNAADPPEGGLPFESWIGMSWMATSGFAAVTNGLNRTADPAIPDEVGLDEGGDGVGPGVAINNWSSVYSKTIPAGTFSIFQPDNGGRNMYGVVVKRAPGSTNSPPGIVSLTPTNNSLFYNPAAGISFTATTVSPNSLDASNIFLSLNGLDVSATLTVAGTAQSRTASYGGLQPNIAYLGRIVVVDQAGRSTTNTFSFDTFSSSTAVAVEAEDYNYENGSSQDASPPAGFANRIGTAEIDYHDNNFTVLATQYRLSDYVGFAVSTDAARQSFTTADATDYQISQIQAGDWLNYTRSFSSNTYRVYVRASSGVAQRVRLDRITGSTNNQIAFALGIFDVPSTTGGATAFAYVPLTDASGDSLVVTLSGTNTFRLTALDANLNLQLNFLLFVPSPTATFPPHVSEVSPAADAINVAPDATIKLTIVHGTTQAVPGGAALIFNGSNVTASASLTPTAEGAVVTYDPPGLLATNTEYALSFVFSDSGGASFSNQWAFTTTSFLNVIPPAFGTAPGSGQGSGFRLKIRKAPDTDALGAARTLANTSTRAEQQLADQLIDPDTTQPFINEAAGPNGDGLATNTVINFNQTGLTTGYFPGDAPFPHLDPLAFPDPNNIAMEATAYLELSAGVYRLGVRSDDGFRLTSGPIITDTNLVLGVLEGGRGDPLPGGATEFDFQVVAAGVYPFRLIWYEGNGGASLELYSVDRTTFKRTLVNDPNTTGSIKAFLSRPAVVFVPTVSITSPTNNTLYPVFPANVTITADASIVNGQIATVEFFRDGTTKIGESTTAPYNFTWNNVPAGRYSLVAKATATNGLNTVSAPIRIIVGTPIISNVVEIGGLAEPTDTVVARWTGTILNNGVAGEFPTDFEVPAFGEDVPTYVDRAHQWNGATPALPLPSYLVGGEYIMSGNDNRDQLAYQLDITLTVEANVYVLVDNRMGDADGATPPSFDVGGTPYMSWLLQNGWTPVTNGLNRTGSPARPDEVGVDEAGDGVGPGVAINQWSSVYVKRLPAGTFSTFQSDTPGQNMYGVVVTRVPTAQPLITSATVATGTITILWTGGGNLQSSPTLGVSANWVNVDSDGSFSEAATGNKFYRVQR